MSVSLIFLTWAQYKELFPKAKASSEQDYADFFLACQDWDINNPKRLAAFCAQIYHESVGLSVLSENLNYTAAGLMKTWPSKFKTRALAVEYQRRGPEAIANKVYCYRMGNGSEDSGDGWRFRGRGYIQLTGKNNYRTYADIVKLPLESNPDLAMVPKNAARIAAAFWATNGCNELADQGDILKITQRINGGSIGLPERIAVTNRFDQSLGVETRVA